MEGVLGTFLLVAKLNAIQILRSSIANLNWFFSNQLIWILLNGELEEEIFMQYHQDSPKERMEKYATLKHLSII